MAETHQGNYYQPSENNSNKKTENPAVQMNLPFTTALYDIIYPTWPEIGYHILAYYDLKNIIVYQSVPQHVALPAVRHQSFKNNHYKVKWILRPSFLSAIFASEWGQRKDHGHLLAITITRLGFEEILRTAVKTMQVRYKRGYGPDARFEWGPDVDLYGTSLRRNELSIHIRGRVLECLHQKWIVSIHDVTNFAHAQRRMLYDQRPDLLHVPEENHYFMLDEQLSPFIGIETERMSQVDLDPSRRESRGGGGGRRTTLKNSDESEEEEQSDEVDEDLDDEFASRLQMEKLNIMSEVEGGYLSHTDQGREREEDENHMGMGEDSEFGLVGSMPGPLGDEGQFDNFEDGILYQDESQYPEQLVE